MIETTKQEVLQDVVAQLKTPNSPFAAHNFNNPLSGPSTLARALANAVYRFIDTPMRRVFNAIHPHTCETEEDLREHLRRKGLPSWKVERRARHRILIGSRAQLSRDIQLPQGLIVAADAGNNNRIEFRLAAPVTIRGGLNADDRGFYTQKSEVECIVAGPVGNVVQDAISQIIDGPSEIDVVYNPDSAPIVEGQFKESFASVRNRLEQAERIGGSAFLTPAWYRSEALGFDFIKQAIFKSAKEIQREGEVKLLVLGVNTELSSGQLKELRDHFSSSENDPGGAAHVVIENIPTVRIDKAITVYFSAQQYVPNQSELDDIVEAYFLSLDDGASYSDAAILSRFNFRPGFVNITFLPASQEISVPAGSLAVQGNYTITAEVFS